jgi:hypothetical protein
MPTQQLPAPRLVCCTGGAAAASVVVAVVVLSALGTWDFGPGGLPPELVFLVLGPALLAVLLAAGAWLAEPPPGRRGRGWTRLLAGLSVLLSAAVLFYGGPTLLGTVRLLLTGG